MFREVTVHGIQYEDKEYGKQPIAETPDMKKQPETSATVDRKALMEQLKAKDIAFKPQMSTDTLLKLLNEAEEEL